MLAEPNIAKIELIKEVEKLKAENKRLKAKVKKYKSEEKNRNVPIDALSAYEWETLVSTWRYFEGSGTIAAVMFAGDIVERFFADDTKYTRKVKEQIARQYWYVDHGIRLEEDFAKNDDTFSWVKFLRFCEGYCRGFKKVVMKEDKKSPEVV